MLRRDWMFKLVGSEFFHIGPEQTRCEIRIDTCSGFSYEYSLRVDGKQLQCFKDTQRKSLKTWLLDLHGKTYRVVLGK